MVMKGTFGLVTKIKNRVKQFIAKGAESAPHFINVYASPFIKTLKDVCIALRFITKVLGHIRRILVVAST
jgi:hypothetical protein